MRQALGRQALSLGIYGNIRNASAPTTPRPEKVGYRGMKEASLPFNL